MATPENTLITRAEFTTDQSVVNGRNLLTTDDVVVSLSKSGRRDLSGFFNPVVASGRAVIERDGDWVILWLINIVLASSADGSDIIITNDRAGTGAFYPTYAASGRLLATSGNGSSTTGPAIDVYVNPNLGITLHGGVAGRTYNGSVVWHTDDPYWAAGVPLPGVADGQPVVI